MGSAVPRLVAIACLLAVSSPLSAQSGWTLVPQAATRENLWSVAYGAGTLIAAGELGTIVSYDSAQKSWHEEASGTGVWLVGAGYGVGRFVVVGDGGTILTSDDKGVTWTPRESGVTTRLNAVAYGAGRWLAVGERGVVLTSTDGARWSTRPSLGPGFLRALAFGQGRFVIGGAGGALFETFDAETFAPLGIATTADIEGVAISASRFWVVGSRGLWATATQPNAWSIGPVVTSTTFRGVAARNAEEAVAVAEVGAAVFRNGAWSSDAPPPPFLATAVTVADEELFAVGFGGGVARVGITTSPSVIRRGGAAEYGSTVTLIGDAGTNQPVTYQWYRGSGELIPGATERELQVAQITPDTSDYRLQFEGRLADGSTQSGSLGVTVPLYPAGQVEVRDPSFIPALPTTPALVVVQPDGKILVAGSFTVSPSGGPSYGLARLNADGSLDPGFRAGEGIATTASIRAMHVLADGRIYVQGNFTVIAGQSRPGLARLLPNGALDLTFQPDSFSNSIVRSAAAADGRLYVQTGTNNYYSPNGGTVQRLSLDGSIDPAFGPLRGHELIAVDSLGRVLAVDKGPLQSLRVGELRRYRSDGSRDPSYRETTVTLFTEVIQAENELSSVVLTESGLYATGSAWTRAGRSYRFEKFLPDGGRDPAYQHPPVIPTGGDTLGFSFAHRPDGGLWQVRSQGQGSRTFVITSYSPSGTLARNRHATLPNQADLLIKAVAPDGSLLGTTGRYTTVESPLVRVRPITGLVGRLTNLSVRGQLESNGEPLIAGFVTSGSATSNTLARAIGPGLAPFGVDDAATDPQLALFRNGMAVATNDDWDASLATRFAALGAFALAPLSRDAALETSVGEGNYTAVVTAANVGRGTVLAELYQPADAPRRFINVSARSTVDVNRPLIAGFTISGEVPIRVLVRASGPALAGSPFNLPGTLPDPQLTLYRGSTALWENRDWDALRITDPGEVLRTAAVVGAFPFPAGSRDSAMVVTLAPGSYTAVAVGAGSGTALVEVYEVP